MCTDSQKESNNIYLLYLLNIKTIKLISLCHLNLKNFKAALDFIEKVLPLVEKVKGIDS